MLPSVKENLEGEKNPSNIASENVQPLWKIV